MHAVVVLPPSLDSEEADSLVEELSGAAEVQVHRGHTSSGVSETTTDVLTIVLEAGAQLAVGVALDAVRRWCAARRASGKPASVRVLYGPDGDVLLEVDEVGSENASPDDN